MKKLCGVVAEFDPFHSGHALLLQQARGLTGCQHVAVIMSACFTQRGSPALIRPHARAHMALLNGADLVAALPAVWSLRDAEHFALGTVSSLELMGCDSICFGSECGDIDLICRTALALQEPNPMMLAAIHSRLDAGMSYPAAMEAALRLVMPQGAALLASPNDTLAVCYIRALHRLGSSMKPFCIRRTGSFHSGSIDGCASSASAVRGAILRGDWSGAAAAVPESCMDIIRSEAMAGKLHRPDSLDSAIMYRLRTMSTQDWSDLPGISEGLDDRLKKAAAQCCTLESLLQTASTRRYPAARLRRLCMHALLGLTQDSLQQQSLPQSLQVLGFRRDASSLISTLCERGVPLRIRAAQLEKDTTEDKARDLWALGAGLPSGMRYTEKTVIL